MNKNKYLKYLMMIFLTLILVAIIVYLQLTNTEDLTLNSNLTFDFREKVYVEDLISNLKGKLINNTLIDTKKVGTKRVRILYYNHYGVIESKNVEIDIRDNVPPTIVINNIYEVEQGTVTNLLDNIFCADNYDDNVICKIEGKYDLNKIGKYHLKISAKDKSNNVTKKSFTLHVTEKEDKSKNKSTHPTTNTNFSDIRKKYQNNNHLIGIDISKWQGSVDFKKIKSQGVEFVMIKIGGQDKKGGSITLDPNFSTNIEQALKNKLNVGIYFYSKASTTKEARKQAEWVIKQLQNYQIQLPIAFDWENWSNYSTYHVSFNTLNNIAASFFEPLEKANYSTMLYSSKYYLENIWYQDEYNIWIAHYTSNDKEKNKYSMWQLCDDGKIDGIDANVDIDIYYKYSK